MADLWCMNVVGPDDVHAAPSREDAERAVAWYQERFKDCPEVGFVVAPWPHSAQSHAESLAKWGDVMPILSWLP